MTYVSYLSRRLSKLKLTKLIEALSVMQIEEQVCLLKNNL